MTEKPASPERLLFIHLPKTGGSSLAWIIDQYYGESAERLITAGELANIRRYLNRPEEELAKVRAISGHMPWGVADYLPGDSGYITMLRHPYERVVSDYYYIYSAPQHPAHELAKSGELTFEDFIRGPNGHNIMTLRMYGYDIQGDKVFYHEGDEESRYSEAVKNLHACAVVGLNDCFEESVNRIADHFQWDHVPEMVRMNTTDGRPRFDDLPQADKNVIIKNNKLDLALYEEARKIFHA